MTKLTPEKLREQRINGFLQIAGEEAKAAKNLLSDALSRQAVYFVQQSAEKLLRAVLEREGIPAGPTHSIAKLVELLSEAHPLRDKFLAFDELSVASTRYRYPGQTGFVASPDVTELPERISARDELRLNTIAFVKPATTTR